MSKVFARWHVYAIVALALKTYLDKVIAEVSKRKLAVAACTIHL